MPASAIKDVLLQRLASIEEQAGRKPGGREKRELKEAIHFELLPRAFTKTSTIRVWLDPRQKLLVVGTANAGKADKLINALVGALSADGAFVQRVNTHASPQMAMTHWLGTRQAPHAFSIDRECELKAADESRAVVKYSRHSLEIAEIAEHVRLGKVATQLGLTWNSRVSFVLTESMALKKLEFLDVVMQATGPQEGANGDDQFDADVAIATGELSQMIPDLLEALGGEVQATP